MICAPARESLPELQGCRALVLAMFTSALTCGPDSWLRIRPYLDLGGIGARLADLINVIGARSQPPTCAPNAKLPLLQPSPSKASTTISLPSVTIFLASHIILICLTCSHSSAPLARLVYSTVFGFTHNRCQLGFTLSGNLKYHTP